MAQITETKKREPSDPYECWCMPCCECVYYDEAAKKCTHPEACVMVKWVNDFYE